jgi:hypothetical protein
VKVEGEKTVTRRCGFGRRFGMDLVAAAAMLCVLLMAFEPAAKADVRAGDGKGVAFGSAAVRTSQKYEARIVHPKGGAIISGATYIQLKARPNIKILSVFIDDQYFTSGPPYTIPWNSATVTNGRHRITIAAATPALGSNALSPNSQLRLQTVQFTVHNKHLLQSSPTPTPDPTATPTPASTPSPKPTPTPTPRPTATPAPASTPSPKPTPTPTPRPTATSTPSPSPTRTPTPTPTPTISSNCSIVTDVGPVITDTSGNAWAITLGLQVSVNGVADATTNNVIELVYSAGLVYQENSSELWWYKSSPSDVWHSAPAPSCPGATPTPIPTSSPTPVPGGGGGPLSVTITGSPTVGPTTLTTAFASVPVGGTPPYSYAWVWGDGTANGTTQNPNHNFTVAGTYTTTLTVTDSASHTASQVKTVLATGAAYYVAKSGNDSNNGTSPATPFLTLTKCQITMRSGNKVCIVNDSGTYTLGANLSLTSSDNNEMWVAGFGQTPIIDGNSATYEISANGATPWAMYGFHFQNMIHGTGLSAPIAFGNGALTFRWNTITGFSQWAMVASNPVNNELIDSNTFINGTYGSGNEPAAVALGTNGAATNNTVSHNLFSNLGGGCILVLGNSGASSVNNIMSYNLATNVDNSASMNDWGCFYMGYNGSGSSGDIIEYNNLFGNNTTYAASTKGIYLDGTVGQGASNTLVKGNICNSCGDWAVFWHCGGGNIVQYNIFDVSVMGQGSLSSVNGYQDTSPCGTGFMTGNHFDHNIIYNTNGWYTQMGAGIAWASGLSGADVIPTDTTNLYYSPTGNAPRASGFTDANPFNANPLFVSPGTNNYALQASSPAFSLIGFPILPRNQGPVNSPFQSAGSAF